MNPDQLPSVSTFRVEKPGKSKFAPSIGGRKPVSTTTTNGTSSKDVSVEAVPVVELATEPIKNSSVNETVTVAESVDIQDTEASTVDASSSTVGKKIESIQSRRMAASVPSITTVPHTTSKEDIKLPSGPKDAASIATASSTSVAEKRTMAYFLKDSGEGREMPTAGGSTVTGSDPSLSPSKTRRIVNLRNIKAPPRSATTSTALAPQVRVVDGAIVYDEKFSAAISMASTNTTTTTDLEQELEYVDEDDEHGKHLTSATYSTKAKGSNRWNAAETDLFYEALVMCGTDFSMVQTLIPHRTRAQIKGKYKLEEKANLARINAALRTRKPFDSSFKDRVKEFIENQNKK